MLLRLMISVNQSEHYASLFLGRFQNNRKGNAFFLFLKNIQNGVGKFNCETALVGFSTMLLMAHGQALHV